MPDDRPDDPLHPPQDAVRRLLAGARHEEPVPDDVAARLDAVLDRLSEGESPGVVDLDAHRRRRRARNLLVAAAAVVVLGVGLSQVDRGAEPATSTASDAGGDGSDASAGSLESGELFDHSGDPAPSAAAPGSRAPETIGSGPIEVTDAEFTAVAKGQAWRAQRSTDGADNTARESALEDRLLRSDELGESSSGASGYSGDPAADRVDRDAWSTCRPGPYGEGRLVSIRYAGNPAVLAIRPPTSDSVVVELLRCRTGAVLRSATVPLP